MQLKWTHQFQFAGFYAALAKGFYRAAGLDVTLLEGGPTINPVDAVLSGAATFGVGNSSLLVERAHGRPVVALAAIYQHSPFVLLARRGDGIDGPKDLQGRKVMIEEHSAEVLAYLHALGLSPRTLTILPYGGDPLVLAKGDIAAISAYSTTEPYELLSNRIPYQTFNPREVGIDFYGDTLFTTENVVYTQTDLVRRFREATLKGWQYALDHQQEIIDLILETYAPNLDRRRLEFEADTTRPLIIPDVVDLGYQSEARWRRIADQFADAGMIPPNYSFEGFIFEGPRPNMRWLYVLLAGTSVLVLIAAFLAQRFYRLNRILRREMELSRILELRLARLAATDDLTQVFNRRKFFELAAEEMDRARATGVPLSVAIIDVDNFKRINDGYGHAAGDEVLRRVAASIPTWISTPHVFARMGGEEFALLLPGSPLEEAGALCETLRAQVEELRLPGQDIRFTVSMGAAAADPEDTSFEVLLARADAALYVAKNDGRNRVALRMVELDAPAAFIG
ncbi:ABC transporter substrate-binding protein [Aquabacter sp. CN5-332]|uniref:GGDEF domain-containing protein n=1 Tax=Aquabacter sp. CN5-332 TaxID=3156608 RepID=UPI0032B611F6